MDPGDATGGLLRQYLTDQDAPCPGCGYNLRGLPGSVCPECRQELRLMVGLVEPRLGAFVAGVVGLGMSLGFCVLLLVWVGAMYVFRTQSGPPLRDLIPLAIGALVSGVALGAWVWRRRAWLGRVESWKRWAWAAAVSAAGVACPVWFMATVR